MFLLGVVWNAFCILLLLGFVIALAGLVVNERFRGKIMSIFSHYKLDATLLAVTAFALVVAVGNSISFEGWRLLTIAFTCLWAGRALSWLEIVNQEYKDDELQTYFDRQLWVLRALEEIHSIAAPWQDGYFYDFHVWLEANIDEVIGSEKFSTIVCTEHFYWAPLWIHF